MEEISVLSKINSKYIFKGMFNFIKDKDFTFKIFFYSKEFQKKLEIKTTDYHKKYLDKKGINLDEYLTSYYYDKISNSIYKDIIKTKMLDCIIDIDSYELCIIEKYKKLSQEIKEKNNKFFTGNEIQIDINSPLFNILSKSGILGEIFTIPLSLHLIREYNLISDYINTFNQLNENNSNYSSVQIFFEKESDVDFFSKININLKQIKRLTIKQEYTSLIKNYDYFFKNLFSLIGLENIMQFLVLDILPFRNYKIKTKILNPLNKLNSLQYLSLSKFSFKSTFTLKLINLKELYLFECNNIKIDHYTTLNIQKLYLYYCFIVNEKKKLLNFPKLEDCTIENVKSIDLIIDFSKSKNLKIFKGDQRSFLNVQNESLEQAIIKSNNNNNSYTDQILLRKLFSFKFLKNVILDLNSINDKLIKDISEDNKSISTLTINYYNEEECNFFKLQEKLKNLSDLTIRIKNKNEIATKVEIEANINCKINKFSLLCGGISSIKFYCQSFQNLVEIDINIINKISFITFPLFIPNCNIIFNSLVKFHFRNSYRPFVLDTFKNNILCMPNLKDFSLEVKYYIKNIEIYYYSFFVNISMLKSLNSINFKTYEDFSKRRIFKNEEDLKKIFSDINLKHIDYINIEI